MSHPDCVPSGLVVGAGRAIRALALVFGAVLLSGCDAGNVELTMVTPRLAIDRQLAEEFAELFSDPDFIQIRLVPNPNPDLPGLEVVKEGLADLALVSNAEAYDPAVHTVVPLYPTVLHIAYRLAETEDQSDPAPIANIIQLLRTATVYAGPPGSHSRLLLETSARQDGIAASEINYVDGNSVCAGVIVVYAPVLPEIPDRIHRCGNYRLFSLGTPSDIGAGSAVDAVILMNPQLKPFVIPRETYGKLTPEPIVTLAVDKLLVARSDLSDTVIYDLLREILRLKPALSVSHPGLFHQLTDDFDVSSSAFVMHPGALAYLQRDEPDIYERYSGIAEVVVTMMIGLISGIYAVFRIINIRRKNRIDAFCREAMEIRDGIASANDTTAALDAIRALQDRAYGLMIHEKLSADESFRIFITLTNDIMADLEGRDRATVGE